MSQQANAAVPRLTPSKHLSTRVWEHALHEERVFNERNNFFLVAEAMFFVFYATLDAITQSWALVAVTVLGFTTTVAWLLVSWRQVHELDVCKARLRHYCEEYPEFERERTEGQQREGGILLLAVIVPLIVASGWLVLFAEILTRPVR